MADRAPVPSPLRPDEQDAILNAKLMNNDRPLRLLLKKMSQVVCANGEAELAQAITSFRLDLETYVLQLHRIEAVARGTAVHEVESYRARVHSMDQGREDTLQSIERLKKELVDVQQDRKNKLEYDALASEIMKYGTREELETQLASLRTTLDGLSEESAKYSEIMTQSKSRFEGIADQVRKLRADVGFEVGERERREVEREGEGDAEEEVKAAEEAADAGAAAAAASEHVTGEGDELDDAGDERGRRGRSSLNPSAAVFKPNSTSRDSTPGVLDGSRDSNSGAPAKRRRSGRGSGLEGDEDAQLAKKRAKEEGEMSDGGEAEEEEEEGAA